MTKEFEALGAFDRSLALDGRDLDVLQAALKSIAAERLVVSPDDLNRIGSQLIRFYRDGVKTETALIAAYNERQDRPDPLPSKPAG
jgi:hypothetical protein